MSIEPGNRDEAEAHSKSLVGTSSEDFALGELKHILELRREKGNGEKGASAETMEANPFADL